MIPPRFVGHGVTHEGTGQNYHDVTWRLLCNLKNCPFTGVKKNCLTCDHVTKDEVHHGTY